MIASGRFLSTTIKASLLFTLLAVLLALPGCRTPQRAVAKDNFSWLYGTEANMLRLDARVYNASEEKTIVYFKLRTSDLLYKSDGQGGPYRSSVRITYAAYADRKCTQLLDSASTMVRDQAGTPGEDKDLIGSMEMRRSSQGNFHLLVTARDLNRETSSSVLIPMDVETKGHRQDFLPEDAATKLPWFSDHLPGPHEVRVRCERYAGMTLFGTHHSPQDRLPAPVFTTSSSAAADPPSDSSFTVQVGADGTFELDARRSGFYHIRTDSTSSTGFTLFVLADTYPYVRTGKDMLSPLRYITSMQEHDKMRTAPDVRKAVERFWTDANGGKDRARDAIATYYGRVESANRHFTGSTEGWKSDRGLVHIIFGTPNNIQIGDYGETWVYGEDANMMSLSFTFTKRQGPYSDNDMTLDRDPAFKGAWYRNVESWRNGRIRGN
ncbi:MAG: GWxTD domain-containing protein [Flavobacteriales bacterium]|nr:GWxTD domain-containing protein [Flavobacteriales bacterium]